MRKLAKDAALALVERAAQDRPEHGGCVMCGIAGAAAGDALGGGAAGAAPLVSSPLAETDAALAVLERFATRPGHVLVVHRRHVERIAELSWEAYAQVQRLAWEAARAVESALAPKRVLVAALGSAAR